MGDAPLAYVETTGGVKVSEEDIVQVGKNDVSTPSSNNLVDELEEASKLTLYAQDSFVQSWSVVEGMALSVCVWRWCMWRRRK